MQEVTQAHPDRAKTIIALLLPVAILLAATWSLIGSFYYTLDDAYIHLQLADMIANRGHFGLHPESTAAPSSSLLWTLWLTFWARLPAGYDYVPLITNIVILTLLFNDLLRWLQQITTSAQQQLWLLIAIIASLNLYWLTLSGMEQLAQVWLTVRVAIAISRGRWQDNSLYLALILLALLRYESLALCLPVLIMAIRAGEARKALTTLAILVLALAAYSLFLHDSLGLTWLPASVQIKSVFAEVGPRTGLSHAQAIVDNIRHVMSGQYSHYLIWLMLGWLYAGRNQAGRQLMAVATLIYIAQALFGRANSGRYEIYVFALCWIALLHNAIPLIEKHTRRPARMLIFMLAVLMLNVFSVAKSVTAPWAAQNIHDQQGQSATLVKDYLKRAVAANDIGLLTRHNRYSVLDLVGLGTAGVHELRNASASGSGWVSTLLEQRKIHYAVVYDNWFPEWPDNLIRVAYADMPGLLLAPAERRVSFYADSPAHAKILLQAINAYRKDYPERTGWVIEHGHE